MFVHLKDGVLDDLDAIDDVANEQHQGDDHEGDEGWVAQVLNVNVLVLIVELETSCGKVEVVPIVPMPALWGVRGVSEITAYFEASGASLYIIISSYIIYIIFAIVEKTQHQKQFVILVIDRRFKMTLSTAFTDNKSFPTTPFISFIWFSNTGKILST